MPTNNKENDGMLSNTTAPFINQSQLLQSSTLLTNSNTLQRQVDIIPHIQLLLNKDLKKVESEIEKESSHVMHHYGDDIDSY